MDVNKKRQVRPARADTIAFFVAICASILLIYFSVTQKDTKNETTRRDRVSQQISQEEKRFDRGGHGTNQNSGNRIPLKTFDSIGAVYGKKADRANAIAFFVTMGAFILVGYANRQKEQSLPRNGARGQIRQEVTSRRADTIAFFVAIGVFILVIYFSITQTDPPNKQNCPNGKCQQIRREQKQYDTKEEGTRPKSGNRFTLKNSHRNSIGTLFGNLEGDADIKDVNVKFKNTVFEAINSDDNSFGKVAGRVHKNSKLKVSSFNLEVED